MRAFKILLLCRQIKSFISITIKMNKKYAGGVLIKYQKI